MGKALHVETHLESHYELLSFFRKLIYLPVDCFSVSKLHLRNAVWEIKSLIFNLFLTWIP